MVGEFALFVLVGFLAQIVDGALGMAFGVIASSSLIALGTPPAAASAAVHAAEVVTTGVSGASHIWHRNVDWRLVARLAGPGVAGGVVGAYVLTTLPEDVVKPLVTLYLAAMAVLILARATRMLTRAVAIPVPIVGGAGGFLDAIGGGGWGPVVNSTLLASGTEPRRTIGSVNTTEFAVALAISITFLLRLDLAEHAAVIGGLITGGILAAPIAGWLLKHLPARIALGLVAAVLAGVTAVNIYDLVA